MKILKGNLIVTGVVRLAYPNLYKPRPNKLDTSKPDEYGVVVLFPKENTEYQPNAAQEIQEMKLHMRSVAEAKWQEKVGKVDYALKDGDAELTDEGEPKYPGYFFLRCNAPCVYPSGDEFVPTVMDGSKRIMESGGNSGDWGRVVMSVFAYETPAKKGVTTRLRDVQFLYEGDRIGETVAPGDGFDEVAGSTIGAGSNVSNQDEYDPFGPNA